jgi:hypothetical protein
MEKNFFGPLYLDDHEIAMDQDYLNVVLIKMEMLLILLRQK